MPAKGNLPPVSPQPTQWKIGNDGLEYPVYDEELPDDDLLDDYPMPPCSMFHGMAVEDPNEPPPPCLMSNGMVVGDTYEDHKRRMNAKKFVKVSKAEADKLISKSIEKTIKNYKDNKGKKGKGIYTSTQRHSS